MSSMHKRFFTYRTGLMNPRSRKEFQHRASQRSPSRQKEVEVLKGWLS